MNPNDQYVMSQVGPMLGQGEQVLFMSTMRRAPGLLMQILLFGGLLGYLMTTFYYVVLTNQRMILIRTKMGLFSLGTPSHVNLGVEQWDARSIQKVTISGFANNRSMTFHMPNGKQTLRISPWMKAISGTKDFFEKVPLFINSGQLNGGQLAGGNAMPQLGAPQGYGPPQMQMQQPQIGFGPGTNVVVTAPDGNRFPATVVQEQQGQVLCASQYGQNWVPAQFVQRA
jgi:hypothetical protein